MTSLTDTLVHSLGRETFAPADELPNYAVGGHTPDTAVFPTSVEAVSEVLSFAATEGKAVTPWGGGTQMALGNLPARVDLVVGLGRLNRILFHEPADLVASVEAGISLEALQRELATQGQYLPLEAPLPSRATVGGILAANASGPSRLTFGTARDWLIGIKMVHSGGATTKAGGRVVKNVTGYDLNKLYTGSLGTLGVIVEATFKVAPLPADRRILVAACPSLTRAVEMAHDLLRQSSTPQALVVINAEIARRLPGLGPRGGTEAAVLVLFAGRKVAVDRVEDDSARLMAQAGAKSVERLSREEGDVLWQGMTDLGWLEEGRPQLALRLSSLPSQVGDVLATACSLEGLPLAPGIVADVGSGLVRLLSWAGAGETLSSEPVRYVIEGLRERLRAYGGHVVVEMCPLEVKAGIDVWGDSVDGTRIMRRIKQELDPSGILNPGRYLGRI